MPCIFHQTPLGIALIAETDGYISKISALDKQPDNFEEQTATPLLMEAAKQLDEYFAGTRRAFDLPTKQAGSDFQQQVWNELIKIDYAKTISYLQQSQNMGNPLAIRAIAAANGKNNLWIVVPCHRVIGASGSLTGYAGGLWRKQWLLQHEAKVAGVGQTRLEF